MPTPRRNSRTDATPTSLDGAIAASAALLATLGVVMVYSTTAPLSMGSAIPPHFLRHLAGLGLGIVIIAVAIRIPLAWWYRLAIPLWAAGVLLLLLTALATAVAVGAYGLEAFGHRVVIQRDGVLRPRAVPADIHLVSDIGDTDTGQRGPHRQPAIGRIGLRTSKPELAARPIRKTKCRRTRRCGRGG